MRKMKVSLAQIAALARTRFPGAKLNKPSDELIIHISRDTSIQIGAGRPERGDGWVINSWGLLFEKMQDDYTADNVEAIGNRLDTLRQDLKEELLKLQKQVAAVLGE